MVVTTGGKRCYWGKKLSDSFLKPLGKKDEIPLNKLFPLLSNKFDSRVSFTTPVQAVVNVYISFVL